MLGKLMKYEFKATRRIFLPLYGLILLVALLLRLFIAFNYSKAQANLSPAASVGMGISFLAYFLLIAAVCVMTLVVLIQRFEKNLLGDEGYLSFTLPVKVHTHIDAKMLVTLIWTVLSVLVGFLSVLILIFDQEALWNYRRYTPAFLQWWNSSMKWITAEWVVFLLVTILSGTLHIYASMAVGNLCPRHRILAGCGAFLGFSIIEEITAAILVTWNVVRSTGVAFSIFGIPFSGSADNAVGLGVTTLFIAVFGAVYYFFTNWVLSRKLNLE